MIRNLQKLLLPRVYNGLSTTIFCVTRKIAADYNYFTPEMWLWLWLEICKQFARIYLFADDAKLFKHVICDEDHKALQLGLNALQD